MNKRTYAAVAGCMLLMAATVHGQPAIRSFELLTRNVREYEKAEWKIDLTAPFSNPYDQREISLDMVLTAPSGAPVVLPCYFEEGDSTLSHWKARFAPQEKGNYSYVFRLNVRRRVAESETAVVTAGAGVKHGFLHKNNYYTFKFDDGQPFRGIGENVAWESRSFENPKWTYDYLLPALSKNGANFFRTWSCPWNLPLEWKRSGNPKRYKDSDQYFHAGGIRRMEELLHLADSLGLYIMLTLDMNSGNWNNSPYNQANGGPVKTWADFFSSTAAMERYKDKLRYVVARWGYSTNIAAWEFFNEIDNGVFNKSDSILIPHSAVTHWHDEMSRYLKDVDPYKHLVTTSISHRDITGLNSIAYIDFNQKHIYKHTEKIPAIYPDYIQTYGKPYVVGEFGYRWEDQDPVYAREADFDYKRGLWYGLFSPTPVLPMSWWWELFDDQKMTPYFNAVRDISDRMLAAGKGQFEQVPVQAGLLHAQAVRCGGTYFVYLLNASDSTIRTGVLLDAAGKGSVEAYDPDTRKYAKADMGAIVLKGRKELILVVEGTKYRTLGFLYEISGDKVIAGIHNREPNDSPARWTSEVFATVGRYPGLWSGDFLFQQDNIDNRQTMIDEAVKEWKKGALVNIMWHACNPALEQPCGWGPAGVLSKLTDAQWAELTTEGTPLNKRWKSRVDEVAVYLQYLKDRGVEVLWRPMHEMNQGAFWWAGRPGPGGTVKLYRMLHDYMVKTRGLTNLIWIWDVQDFGSLAKDVVQFDPGRAYWDIAALDVYDKSGYTQEKYDVMVKAAGDRPIAIGECQRLPTADLLRAQPRWTFFMGWSELEFSHNTAAEIRALHTADNIVTLDKMPGWK
jgi:hypothetical protein